MLALATFVALFAALPVTAPSVLAGATDSVVVSRDALTLSFVIDTSAHRRNGAGLQASSILMMIDRDAPSQVLVLSFTAVAGPSPDATVIQLRGCRTSSYDCRDSTVAAAADGRLTITIRHSEMIGWLFRERPSAVYVEAAFASARAGYIGVRYIDPPLPSPSKDALIEQDSVAAAEGFGPWTRMLWVSSDAGKGGGRMQVGADMRAYLGEMQCRPLDDCHFCSDFVTSEWKVSDSSVVRLTVTDNPRHTTATITALRPGKSTITVEGVHGPSDDLPRSARVHAFSREIVVTDSLGRGRVTPRPRR